MLVREIAALGGKTVHRDETNRMQSKWLIRRDQFGLMIDLTGVPFHDVDAEFTRWFGKPAIFAATNLDGMPQAVFKATQAGVAINYSGTKDGVSIVIIKPMNGAMFLLEAIDR